MKKIAASLVTLLTPAFALAQFGEINTFVGKVSTFINGTLIPLLFGLALLLFLWGVFNFFINGGEAGKREEGRKYMFWAVVALVIMVSVFGIVNLIAGGLGFSSDEQIQNIPNVPTNNN